MISKIPQPTPQPQPAPQPVRMTIKGQLLYPKGPWGSKRPLRHRGGVVVREGKIWNPRGHIKEKRPTGSYKEVQLDEVFGGVLAPLYGGTLVSSERFSESDGTFSITTDPILPYTPLVLEVRDYNFVSAPGRNINVCYRDLRPYIDFSPSMINLSSQGTGMVIMPWRPPAFMSQMAVINQVAFHDTQKTARRLAELVKSPTYPTVMRLTRESELSQVNVSGDDFSLGQEMLKDLADPQFLTGFPQRLVAELIKIPRLSTNGTNIDAAVAEMLERLVSLNIQQLETGGIVKELSTAVERALPKTYYFDPDIPFDMITLCTITAIAGFVARDGAKLSVASGADNLANSQKMLWVEVKLTK